MNKIQGQFLMLKDKGFASTSVTNSLLLRIPLHPCCFPVLCSQHSSQSDPFERVAVMVLSAKPAAGSPEHSCPLALPEFVCHYLSDPFFPYYSFPRSSVRILLVLALMYQACFCLRAFAIACPMAGTSLLLIATWLSL